MRKCERCDNKIKKSGKRFCSLSCANMKRPDRKTTLSRIVKECLKDGCEKTFEVVKSNPKKFCSRSCAASVNNKGISRYHDNVTVCSYCVKPTGSKNKTYCNMACRQNDRVAKWLSGELDGNGKYAIKGWVRDFVIDRAGGRCEAIDSRTGLRCSEDRIKPDGKTVLQVDHVDGDWLNSTPDNLRALCPTCHALTETYGAGNMGRGRTWKKSYNQFKAK